MCPRTCVQESRRPRYEEGWPLKQRASVTFVTVSDDRWNTDQPPLGTGFEGRAGLGEVPLWFQDHSEPRLVLDHPFVGGLDLLERVRLYLRDDLAEGTELEGVL